MAEQPKIKVKSRVSVDGYDCLGIVRFKGKAVHESDAKGKLRFGIELDEPVGKNNGTIGGHEYFKCDAKRGVFVAKKKLTLAEDLIKPESKVNPVFQEEEDDGTKAAPKKKKNSSTKISSSPTPGEFEQGQRVKVEGYECEGTIRFVGDVNGTMRIGVELDEPIGKHNGKSYFTCADKCGILTLSKKITIVEDAQKKEKNSKKEKKRSAKKSKKEKKSVESKDADTTKLLSDEQSAVPQPIGDNASPVSSNDPGVKSFEDSMNKHDDETVDEEQRNDQLHGQPLNSITEETKESEGADNNEDNDNSELVIQQEIVETAPTEIVQEIIDDDISSNGATLELTEKEAEVVKKDSDQIETDFSFNTSTRNSVVQESPSEEIVKEKEKPAPKVFKVKNTKDSWAGTKITSVPSGRPEPLDIHMAGIVALKSHTSPDHSIERAKRDGSNDEFNGFDDDDDNDDDHHVGFGDTQEYLWGSGAQPALLDSLSNDYQKRQRVVGLGKKGESIVSLYKQNLEKEDQFERSQSNDEDSIDVNQEADSQHQQSMDDLKEQRQQAAETKALRYLKNVTR